MAKTVQHTISCGITPVSRVHVRRESAKYRQNASVFVGSVRIGEVYENKGRWIASNAINSRVKPSMHKTAHAAVKALVCGQVRSERTSRKLPY